MEALCFPASDQTFSARVRGLIRNEHWDLESPDGVALMQALLRGSYPNATVQPQALRADGTFYAARILEVIRDGSEEADHSANWLAVVRDRHGAMAFGLAMTILRDRSAAEDVVDVAFSMVAASTSPTVDVESVRGATRWTVARQAVAWLRRERAAPSLMPSQALELWRVAERRLVASGPSIHDHAMAQADVVRRRSEYQRSAARAAHRVARS